MTEASLSPIGLVRVRADGRRRILALHKYFPIAVLYFFFNSVGLPTGLFLTGILSPVFYLWLVLHGRRWVTAWFLALLLPFFVAHSVLGIDSLVFYARSTALLWTAYVTGYFFCWALLRTQSLERLFDELIVANFLAAILALLLLPTPVRTLLWDNEADVIGASHLFRLRLLTSEPSVYGGLLIPLVVFAILRLMRAPGRHSFYYALMIGLPFLLCQSFEGIGSFVIAIGLATLTSFRHLLRQRRTIFILLLLAVLVVALVLIPNPISQRLTQVANGEDSSAHSRTTFSFLVAYAVATSKSLWWGAGLGQGKLVDVSNLDLGFVTGIIPNAVAGTFAEFGVVGMTLRFAVEITLLFRTRVYNNPFRLAMFVVAFAYQLSGSYLNNVQEYLMWCFAFGPFFPEMDRRKSILEKHNVGS
jgi:hypothetical protein